MTVQTSFHNWQTCGWDHLAAPYDRCSPNLLALEEYVIGERGGQTLGCHVDRDVRSGGSVSSHAYGAAWDWRYQNPGPGRDVLLADVLPWLIDNSLELGIDAVHDYAGGRIWRPPGTSGRPKNGDGWKTQRSSGNMGNPSSLWIHVETHADTFTDATPIPERLEQDDMRIEPDYIAKPGPGLTGAWLVVAGATVRPAVTPDTGDAASGVPAAYPNIEYRTVTDAVQWANLTKAAGI